MPPTFPNELVAHIFTFISCDRILRNYAGIYNRALYQAEERDAKDALIDCSTVCRVWRQIALPHVFHTIAISFDPLLEENDGETCLGEDEHERHCSCQRWRSLQAFSTFLEASPHIAGVIKELRLFKVDGGEGCPSRYDGASCAPTRLVSIFYQLPALRVIHLQDIILKDDEEYDPEELKALGLPLSLDRFYYGVDGDYPYEVSLTALLPLILILGNIQEFHLDSVVVKKSGGDSSEALPLDFEVGALKLRGFYEDGGLVRDCLSLFLDSASTSTASLHTIYLADIVDDDLPVLQRFVAITGHQLLNITLYIHRLLDAREDDLDSLDLSMCTRLESLTFGCDMPCADENRLAALAPVISSLNPNACLHTITFDICRLGRSLDELETVHEVDDALTQIRSLKHVILKLDFYDREKDAGVDIGAVLFPSLEKNDREELASWSPQFLRINVMNLGLSVNHTAAIHCAFGARDFMKTTNHRDCCVEDFLAFLTSFSEVQPYVWELGLAAPVDDCTVDVIQKVPRLRVLRLYNLPTDSLEPHIIAPCVGPPHHLDRLEFSNNICDVINGILAVTSLSSDIGSLDLRCANFVDADTRRTSFCRVFEALQLDNCVGFEAFLCLFRPALAPTTRLTTLTLTDVDWVGHARLTTSWRVVSPSVVNLTLDPLPVYYILVCVSDQYSSVNSYTCAT
ncbi:hypothetical protein NM688_g5193 [Phlebia brevispora]|uniref:Uncharacterized protein n=1 Tax=Phlebia brevispora TaxID=194682 RepID=A0ACC1SZD0_9APHY|nr:hypothetical protein NM688_g5193 [Phlebia brevispora]